MSGVRNSQALQLYKALIKEAKQFTAYNYRYSNLFNAAISFIANNLLCYRNYALRRIRDAFRENKNITDPATINDQIAEGTKNLEIIKRQVLIGRLYSTDKLVIENVKQNC